MATTPLQAAQTTADEHRLRLERLRWAFIQGDVSGVIDAERTRVDDELRKLEDARNAGSQVDATVGGASVPL